MSIIHYFARMNAVSSRRGIVFLILISAICVSSAQITIDGRSLPTSGDSILYKTVSYPEPRILMAIGSNVVWDYTNLHSPFLSLINFEGSRDDEGNEQVIAYEDGVYKYTFAEEEGTLALVTTESDLIEGKIKTFSDPQFLRPQILKLGMEDFDQSVASEILSNDEIPETLSNRVSKINLPLKITTQTMKRTSVDAAGTLVLPWGAQDVLLVKVLITKKLICTFQEGDDWVPLSEEQLNFLDLDYEQTYTDFHFYSADSKLPLMIIHRDQDNKVEFIKYQVREAGQSDIDRASGRQEIAAYPNPTFGRIKFEFLNYPKGTYVVEVTSVLGKKLWTQSYDLEADGLIMEDFSFLRRSTYMYTISDQYGNKLTTKRLVIITP